MLIKKHWILGIGNANIEQGLKAFTKDELWGIEGGGLHNMFIQIGLANGIIALTVIVVFLVWIIGRLLIYADKSNDIKDRKIVSKIIALSLSIISINLFESNLIYIVSFISLIFWIYLSFAIDITYKE